MNHNSHGFLFFFLISCLFIFLFFSHSTSARLPPSNQGVEETHKKLSHGMVQVQADSWPDFPHIMGGREKGENEEKEWEKRKMMLEAEAHLDYVYTQNEKP